MTGARVSFDLDDAGVRAALSGAAVRLDDPRPLLDGIGARLETGVAERFARETGPDGVAWTPSRRARKSGGKTLTKTARLRRSITRAVRAREVLVGSNVVYAAIHQFGGDIRQKARGQRLLIDDERGGFVSPRARKGGLQRIVDAAIPARDISLPARPFLGVSEADRAALARIVSRHLREGVR